jgi:hypothetical protein
MSCIQSKITNCTKNGGGRDRKIQPMMRRKTQLTQIIELEHKEVKEVKTQ